MHQILITLSLAWFKIQMLPFGKQPPLSRSSTGLLCLQRGSSAAEAAVDHHEALFASVEAERG